MTKPHKGLLDVAVYTDELAVAICAEIAAGKTMKAICEDPNMPHLSTVVRWLRDKPEFKALHDEARLIQADTLADEIMDIANAPLMGEETMEREFLKGTRNADGTIDGKAVRILEKRRADMLGHRKLQVNARMWRAQVLNPQKYANKQNVEVGGSVSLKSVLDSLGDD